VDTILKQISTVLLVGVAQSIYLTRLRAGRPRFYSHQGQRNVVFPSTHRPDWLRVPSGLLSNGCLGLISRG